MFLNGGMILPPFSTWWTITASAGFSWSRFGPTVPVESAALRVWHPEQPALPVKTALPATGSPCAFAGGAGVAAAVVVVDAAGAGAAPYASFGSLPNTSTAASIGRKNTAHTVT